MNEMKLKKERISKRDNPLSVKLLFHQILFFLSYISDTISSLLYFK